MDTALESFVNQFKIDRVRVVSDYFSRPSSTLYTELYQLRKDKFDPDERIVFACFDTLEDDHIKLFLSKLNEYSQFIDISNFFILVVSNRPWIANYLAELNPSDPIQYQNLDIISSGQPVVNNEILFDPPATVCNQPWMSLHVKPNGMFAPCCFYQSVVRDENGNPYRAEINTITEVYNSQYMHQLRNDFKQGKKPEPCARCWKEEDNGAESKRQLFKHRFKPFAVSNWEQDQVSNLKYLDVAFGNVCNLKCRICNPTNSSLIAQERIANQDLFKNFVLPGTNYMQYNDGRWIKNDQAQLWKDIETLDILYFDFSGGEPMLSRRHFQVLRQLIAIGRAGQVSLHYNTNGTTFPDEHVEMFDHFKKVDIAVSIDDIGARFEYQRANAVWAEVQDNLKKFFAIKKHNILISLHLAISIQNVFYLPEICEWIKTQDFDTIHFSNVYFPGQLSIVSMTEEARQLVIERLGQYQANNTILDQFIQQTISTVLANPAQDTSKFTEYMKTLDQLRNENFAEHHLEIAQAMKYHL